MKELMVKGKQEFMGVEIPVVEGGFGEGQRVISVKNVSEIHREELGELNRLINRNIARFGEHDLINLLNGSETFRNFAKENGLIGSNRTKDVFVLSERGYTKLVAMMDNSNNKKWEVMDKLIDEYFAMRKVINSNEQLKANLLLSIYNGGQEGVLASKQLTEMEVKEATTPLLAKREEDKPLVDFATKRIDTRGTISITEATKTFELKRGQITNWAKDNGYIHKTIVEVNKKGEEYFKVVGVEHKNIAILPEGINLIREYLEEIRNSKTRR